MKRLLSLSLLFLLVFGLSITITALEGRRKPDWRVALDNYLSQKVSSSRFMLQTIDRASKPWNFTAKMGRPVRYGWLWGITSLPYPPTELRCVLLKHAGQATYSVVYVGYHSDSLWRVGWLVHEETTKFVSEETLNHLSAVGCNLGLKEVKTIDD